MTNRSMRVLSDDPVSVYWYSWVPTYIAPWVMYTVLFPEATMAPTLSAKAAPVEPVESTDTSVSTDCAPSVCGRTMSVAPATTPRSTEFPSASTL